MASVELRGITKSYAGLRAVDGLSLRVEKGEFLSLLGPSGCGKTTTLQMIAGFVKPDRGEILFDGTSVERVSPHKRNIGLVFQSYALFPHLSVYANIAFGLEMRTVPRAEVRDRVLEALDLVQMRGLEDRLPRQLSGGQQQRVALARALVIRPAVLLLDEPLSNLDARLRQEMRGELIEIQRRVGITTIFVTHDQDEALTMSRRVVVMNRGIVEQIGSPEDIYERPRSAFVAGFIGESNMFAATVRANTGGETLVETEGGLAVVSFRDHSAGVGDQVLIMVRPERMRLAVQPNGKPARAVSTGRNGVAGRIDTVSYLGSVTHFRIVTSEVKFLVVAPQSDGDGGTFSSGDNIVVEWEPRHTLLFARPEVGSAADTGA